jgi:hypothetical protein
MSYDNPRIRLTDTVMDMFMKMSDGNPGALTVLMRSMKEGPAIDPQSALGEICVILSLDTHDIYGHEIWGFYKDVCGQDLVMMLALLRAVQLGFAAESEIKRAITDRGSMTNERKAELLAKVKDRLPLFGQQVELEAQAA